MEPMQGESCCGLLEAIQRLTSLRLTDQNQLTNLLRSRLKDYAQYTGTINSTLKDVHQLHTELDSEMKPITLVKGRLDRAYDQLGEQATEEIKCVSGVFEWQDGEGR